MAKVKGKDPVAEKAERAYIEEHLSVLYEVGLSIQTTVDGSVLRMSEKERREALLANVLSWMSSVGEFSIPDPDAAAKRILRDADGIYDGEEIIDVMIS